jgi:hypothetical protein
MVNLNFNWIINITGIFFQNLNTILKSMFCNKILIYLNELFTNSLPYTIIKRDHRIRQEELDDIYKGL